VFAIAKCFLRYQRTGECGLKALGPKGMVNGASVEGHEGGSASEAESSGCAAMVGHALSVMGTMRATVY
jgi:hypothetical protein